VNGPLDNFSIWFPNIGDQGYVHHNCNQIATYKIDSPDMYMADVPVTVKYMADVPVTFAG
jgi:hypothetical protein